MIANEQLTKSPSNHSPKGPKLEQQFIQTPARFSFTTERKTKRQLGQLNILARFDIMPHIGASGQS